MFFKEKNNLIWFEIYFEKMYVFLDLNFFSYLREDIIYENIKYLVKII